MAQCQLCMALCCTIIAHLAFCTMPNVYYIICFTILHIWHLRVLRKPVCNGTMPNMQYALCMALCSTIIAHLAFCTMPNVHCVVSINGIVCIVGIVHNAKQAMSVRPFVVGEAQMALFTMPNVHRMTVIKTEHTANNGRNRDLLLVKSSTSSPLIGREGHQNKYKGLTLIRKCNFGIVNNA